MVNLDDFDCDRPERTACPHPETSGYQEVDTVRHKVEGWSLCEVYDTCPQRNNCDWAGERQDNSPMVSISKERLRMIRRAFGVFSTLHPKAVHTDTMWVLETCQEAVETAKREYNLLRHTVGGGQ